MPRSRDITVAVPGDRVNPAQNYGIVPQKFQPFPSPDPRPLSDIRGRVAFDTARLQKGHGSSKAGFVSFAEILRGHAGAGARIAPNRKSRRGLAWGARRRRILPA